MYSIKTKNCQKGKRDWAQRKHPPHLLLKYLTLPFLLKYCLDFLPERANWDERGPSSSMIWAIWSTKVKTFCLMFILFISNTAVVKYPNTHLPPGRTRLPAGGQRGSLPWPAQRPAEDTRRQQQHNGGIIVLLLSHSPCRRRSRCQLACRSPHQSEPRWSGTDRSGCLHWSACAENREELKIWSGNLQRTSAFLTRLELRTRMWRFVGFSVKLIHFCFVCFFLMDGFLHL